MARFVRARPARSVVPIRPGDSPAPVLWFWPTPIPLTLQTASATPIQPLALFLFALPLAWPAENALPTQKSCHGSQPALYAAPPPISRTGSPPPLSEPLHIRALDCQALPRSAMPAGPLCRLV